MPQWSHPVGSWVTETEESQLSASVHLSLLRERWMLFRGVAALGEYLYSSISTSRSTVDINHWLRLAQPLGDISLTLPPSVSPPFTWPPCGGSSCPG